MARPPLLLNTLEAVVGEQTLRQALRVYFMRYRFQHPTGSDFLDTVEEVSGRKDLEPYLAQAFKGTEVLDYSVDSLTSDPAGMVEERRCERSVSHQRGGAK